MDLRFDQLHTEPFTSQGDCRVLLRSLSGSRVYGTHHAQSDFDYRGIFAFPMEAYLSLVETPDQISDTSHDITYFSLKRVMELLCEANPNMLELVFTPDPFIFYRHCALDLMFQNKSYFVTKKVIQSFGKYAYSQIKKAKGQNRWSHFKEPPKKPIVEDFIWILLKENGFRPQPLNSATETNFWLSKVPHSEMYRIYQAPEPTDFLKDCKLLVHSVPKDFEHHFMGFLTFNEVAFQQAKRDYRNYHQWLRNRNPKRWQKNQLSLDYDSKNMMHTFRLLHSCLHLIQNGEPLVKLGDDLFQRLHKILNGDWKFDSLLDQAESLWVEIENQNVAHLSEAVDKELVSRWLIEMTEIWHETSDYRKP